MEPLRMQKKILFYDSTSCCPFAHRTWLALEELELEYETRKVDLSNKPQDFQDLYHQVWPDPEAPAKVPIIVDRDGFTLVESNVTVQYLDDKYGAEPTRLLPDDAVQRAKVLLFAEVFSAKVFPHVYGLLRAGTPEAIAQTEASLTAGLTTLDAFLRRHGSEEGGAYLLGGRYSFAETAASPFLLRMLVVQPHYRGFDAAAVARERGLNRLSAWLEACMARPSLKKTGPADAMLIQAAKKFVAA